MATFQVHDNEGKTVKSLIATLNVIFTKIEQKLDEVNDGIKDLKDGTLLQDVAHAAAAAAEAVAIAVQNSAAIGDIKKDIYGIFLIKSMQNENVKLRKHVNHLENYSRRSNLVIRGITENEGETSSGCENAVRN